MIRQATLVSMFLMLTAVRGFCQSPVQNPRTAVSMRSIDANVACLIIFDCFIMQNYYCFVLQSYYRK